MSSFWVTHGILAFIQLQIITMAEVGYATPPCTSPGIGGAGKRGAFISISSDSNKNAHTTHGIA
jgi:hypothetical protein